MTVKFSKTKYTILFVFVFIMIVQKDIPALDSMKTKGLILSDTGRPVKKYALDSPKTKRSIGRDIINDAVIFAEDGAAYFTIPFHLSATGWLWTAGIIGATAGTMTTDKEIKKLVSGEFRTTYNHDILDGPTAYGFVQYPSMAAGALYLTGLLARQDWMRVTGRLWMEGLAYSGLTVMGLRYVLAGTARFIPTTPGNTHGSKRRAIPSHFLRDILLLRLLHQASLQKGSIRGGQGEYYMQLPR